MRKSTILLVIMLVTTHSATAELTKAQAANIESNVESMKSKLNLSDEQSEQLEGILKSSVEQRLAIMDEYEFDPEKSGIANVRRLGMQKVRAMQKAVNRVEEDTQSQLEEILDDEQLNAFEKLTK